MKAERAPFTEAPGEIENIIHFVVANNGDHLIHQVYRVIKIP